MQQTKQNMDNDFLDHINQFLMDRFRYRKPPMRKNRAAIPIYIGANAQFDLYLKILYPQLSGFPELTLLISRISFKKTRAGHGTALLSFLIQEAKALGLKHIGVEIILTKECESFAVKSGFKPIGNDNFLLDI